MRKGFLSLLLLGSMLAPAAARTAERAEKILPSDMIGAIKLVTEMAISPDTQWIAYALRTPMHPTNSASGYSYQIWLVDTHGGEPRPLTHVQYLSRQIYWFKDSQRIAFLGQRTRETPLQIYTIALDGKRARPLTCQKWNIKKFKFSPDEKFVAFVQSAELAHSQPGKHPSRKRRSPISTPPKRDYLYLFDLSRREAKLLSNENLNVLEFSWSPQGNAIDFTARESFQLKPASSPLKRFHISVQPIKRSTSLKPNSKPEQNSCSPDK